MFLHSPLRSTRPHWWHENFIRTRATMREHLKDLVARALERELAARRSLRPHAQLGIAPAATATAIDRAYARLRGRYETISIAEYGESAVASANAIAELLRRAHESMQRGRDTIEPLPQLQVRPRADETHRALEALRAAIARRLAEAHEHRRCGRVQEAIRGFESVVLLERGNETARQALRELRDNRRKSGLARMLSRVFRRPVALAADSDARTL
jgi:hypothetical protein